MAILSYDISVVGQRSIDAAFAGIEARLRAHNRTVAQMAGGKPGASATSVARAARGVGDSAGAGAKRALEQGAREEIRIRNAINNLNVRAVQKEERARLVMVRKEGSARERLAKSEARVLERHSKARSQFVQETLGRGVGRVSGTVKAVGTAGAAMLGVGGAGLAASAVASTTRLDELVRRTIIGGTGAGQKAAIDPDTLRKRIVQQGIESGVDAEQVGGGVQEFVSKTGNIDVAMKSMKMLATFSQATGGDMRELSALAASMFNNGISSTDDMAQALSTLTFQGKKASFELKDMAQFMPSVMAKGRALGMTGVEGAKGVGSLLQIAQMGTQNSAESATAVERMMDAFTAKGSKFESGEQFSGRAVQIFTDKSRTKMRNPLEVIPELLKASRGNATELFDAMDIRGSRALSPLVAKYNETVAGATGTDEQKAEAGKKAVVAMLSDFKNVSGGYTDIQKDASEAMKSFSVQMGIINAKLKKAMSDELLPELMKLAPEILKLIPYVGRATKMFVDLVSFFMGHPFQSVAIVVGAQLAADFAKARLGSMVGGLIQRVFSGLRLPAPVGGGFGGGRGIGLAAPSSGRPNSGTGAGPMSTTAAGALGAVANGAALGLTIASAIITANVVQFEKGEAEMKRSGEVLNQIRDMNSAEDAPQARKLVMDEREKLNDLKKPGLFESLDSLWMPDKQARSIAQTFGLAASDTQVNTQESNLKEEEAKLSKLESLRDVAVKLQAAGVSQEAAAKAMSDAAVKLGLINPPVNRGNAPSPAKT